MAMVTTGIGDKHFLIPIEAVVRVSEDFVTIEHGREKVRGALELDPNTRCSPASGAKSTPITATLSPRSGP